MAEFIEDLDIDDGIDIDDETLVYHLTLPEDEELDKQFDDEEMNPVNEAVNVGLFSCSICEKKYKTKKGMERHERTKHFTEELNISSDTILSTILECKSSLEKNRNYTEKSRAMYNQMRPEITGYMAKEVSNLCRSLRSSGDIDKFYTKFYANFVSKGTMYFPLPRQEANLLMRKFGEKLVEMVQRKEGDEDVDFKKGITPEEFDVLQYLAGYVIKSLTRKMKRISTDVSKKMIILLNAMTDNNDKINQRYIQTMDRGGLTATRKEIQDIFLVAEKKFRHADFLRNRTINGEKLAVEVSREIDVFTSFTSVISEISGVEKELALNLLEQMLTLFFRVRSFSAARASTIKHRLATKSKKTKGLRKTIKGKEQ